MIVLKHPTLSCMYAMGFSGYIEHIIIMALNGIFGQHSSFHQILDPVAQIPKSAITWIGWPFVEQNAYNKSQD